MGSLDFSRCLPGRSACVMTAIYSRIGGRNSFVRFIMDGEQRQCFLFAPMLTSFQPILV